VSGIARKKGTSNKPMRPENEPKEVLSPEKKDLTYQERAVGDHVGKGEGKNARTGQVFAGGSARGGATPNQGIRRLKTH